MAINALRGSGIQEVIRIGAMPVIEGGLPRHAADAREQLADVVAEFYLRGHSIDWAAWNRPHNPCKTSLPTYPFNRHRCWLEPDEIRPPIRGYRQ
jgi:acyl transferase domain-containing protein